MQFQTPVHIAPAERPITYDDRLLFLGSCFADAVSACMATYYFRLTANPFGTLYNPLSIAQAIQLREVPELVEWGGLYHSMMHHGDFSSASREETYARCAESIRLMQSALADATVICVTFGTAWVYELSPDHSPLALRPSPFIVANCHKMPASHFTRRRLSVEEIVAAWQPIIESYPDKQFIFTVSPIRHLKDGLHENQLSKATLLQAIDQMVNGKWPNGKCLNGKWPNRKSHYFESYEIMLDELRDYRFYAEDMVHPSDQAVRYIFQRFVDAWCSDATKADMQLLHQLYLDRQHRFLHPDSPEAAAFLTRLEQKTASLHTRFPWI